VVRRPVGTAISSALAEGCHDHYFTPNDPTRHRFALQIPVASASRRKASDHLRIPKHLLFYRFDDDEVFVLRVVHGARDLERLFS
jgi:hypothetical protein